MGTQRLGMPTDPTRRRRVVVAIVGVGVLAVGGAAYAVVDRGGTDDVGGEDPALAAADASSEDLQQGVADAADPSDPERADEERAAREAEEREAEEREAEERAAREAEEAERRETERREREEREAEEARRAEERAERERQEAAERAQRQLVDAQERLRELGYLVGPADGELGQQTSSALMAFQSVNGLSVDGQLGPQTLAALESPREPSLRGGPSTRIEVDMDRQVLHLVEGGARVTTMKTSTGRGGTFQSAAGETLRAETPVGTYTIGRRIAGEKPSSYGIGSMWDPMYFHGPWAIHGSPNVPAGPASSGCVRVAMADGRWLFERVPNGTAVVLYGGTHVFTP